MYYKKIIAFAQYFQLQNWLYPIFSLREISKMFRNIVVHVYDLGYSSNDDVFSIFFLFRISVFEMRKNVDWNLGGMMVLSFSGVRLKSLKRIVTFIFIISDLNITPKVFRSQIWTPSGSETLCHSFSMNTRFVKGWWWLFKVYLTWHISQESCWRTG